MGVGHTVLQVILQDHLGGAAEGGSNRGQLDQHLGAVTPVLHHPLHRFQVADGPGQPVQHGLGLGMHVAVDMAVLVLMVNGMTVHVAVSVVMKINFFFFVFVHGIHAFFGFFKTIHDSAAFYKPPGGIGEGRRNSEE